MDNPTDEPFFGSKTMILLCIGIGAIVALVVLAVAVKVIWGIDVFQLVSSGILGISAHSGAGTVRNMNIDGNTRALNAATNTGITPGQLQTPASPPPMTPLSGLAGPPTPPPRPGAGP